MAEYTDIYIEGVKLPTPSTYKAGFEDLDAEGIRPITTGILKRNRIRARVAKYELTWLLKDFPDTKKIFEMLEPETFTAKVYDYKSNSYVNKTMYCSKCEYEYVRTLNGIKAKALAANIVEV